MKTKRVNARIDDRTAEQLQALVLSTGKSVSVLIAELIERYCRESMTGFGSPGQALSQSGFIGCASGAPNLSEKYKSLLSKTLEKKI